MRPVPSGRDRAHLAHADAERSGERKEGLTGRATGTDGTDVVFGDPGHAMAHTTQHLGWIDALGMFVAPQDTMPTLTVPVARVRHGGAEEEVVWPHAARIVAVVANPQLVRDRAEVQFPRDTVGIRPPQYLSTAGRQQAITQPIAMAAPFPASIPADDLRPEAFCQAGHRLCCAGTSDGTEPAASLLSLDPLVDRPAAFAGEREDHVSYYSWVC